MTSGMLTILLMSLAAIAPVVSFAAQDLAAGPKASRPAMAPQADPAAPRDVLRIENALYAVEYDPLAESFALRHKPAQRRFAVHGAFAAGGGQATVTACDDPHLGRGQGIDIVRSDGNRDRLALYPSLPFVVFSSRLHNGSSTPVVHSRVKVLDAALDLGRPASELRAFGTGGLGAATNGVGSYAYLGCVDPATRHGAVGGWITQDRGSGVVLSSATDGAVRMTAQIDYGRLRIEPGQDAALETFALGWFDDARLGLEAYADAVAKVYAIRLPPQPSGFCTWYMEKHGGACDELHLDQLAAVAAKELKPFGFGFVQIDDHWQAGVSTNGPKRNFTSHAEKGPYPGGMKAAADRLKALGLTPGLWFMPFAGTSYDPFFAEHQDWFATGPDGRPFETTWGGTCLDMTQPGARDHLRRLVQRIAHEWGYRFFKLDGLWTGTATRLMYVNNEYQDDHIGEATLHDPGKTPIEAFRDGLKLVREVAGRDVFLLGCCVSQNMRSFGGSFGLVDAMRVGPDTGAGNIGAPHASRNYFLHGRVWQNDPDCVSVRARTPLGQARLNATFTTIAGHLFYNSDWIPDLPPERLDILKRTLPAHDCRPRPVDLFENDPARLWLLTDARRGVRRDIVALYNWNAKSNVTIACAADRIGLPAAEEYVAFDFWANTFIPPFRGVLTSELPPASCRVLAVRPIAGHPQVLSTSRHVTQGILDVIEETWDAAARTLSGTSRVVGGDPYELRIALPAGPPAWRAADVVLSPDALEAGVKTRIAQQGSGWRVTIESPSSRDVRWLVRCDKAGVESASPQPATRQPAAAQDPLPGLRRLMETPLRDTSICRGPEGTCYLPDAVRKPFRASVSRDAGKSVQYDECGAAICTTRHVPDSRGASSWRGRALGRVLRRCPVSFPFPSWAATASYRPANAL
ncbi:MAG TPA: alpha-galactosidase [Verrucomicrobiota bacterium]|nr:alpha-galactosidase [Verrucomicrobiota bacterium]HNU51874.1 alpha-galactosidase [Verrucomicrobiota bacterium]